MKQPPARLILPVLLLLFTMSTVRIEAQVDSTTHLFNMDTVVRQLGFPWEITYGPDDSLWMTEARGYRVLRISSDRSQAARNVPPNVLMRIPLATGEINFGRNVGTWPQGGMQGLAIHPEFPDSPYVFVSYVYRLVGTCPGSPGSPCYYRTKIVRCRFWDKDSTNNPSPFNKDTLVILDTVLSNLPGSNDHNSGRMTISPVKESGEYKLYYTIGDMGMGQFNNASRQQNAQNRDTCEGKILRLNTSPDNDASTPGLIHDYHTWRNWIPNDNPFLYSGTPARFQVMRTPVYSWGHRNPQGLVWGQVNGTWRLYSSEHGDRSDDEVNIIEDSANYGWPRVSGRCDDNYSNTDAFPNNNILAGNTITNEVASWCNVVAGYPKREPIFSMFNWSASAVSGLSGDIFTWPTVGASGLDFYKGNIPGWKNSLMVVCLKYGVFRLKLNAAGTGVDSTVLPSVADTFPLLHGWRVRDIAISPNGGYIWAVVDSSGSTSGPTGGFNSNDFPTRNGGTVLKLTYKNLTLLPFNPRPDRPDVVSDLISIYPNPVGDLLQITGKKNLAKPVKVQIFDVSGQLVQEELSYKNDFTINVSRLTAGVYMLKLFNGNDQGVQIEKFVKK